MTVIYNTNFTHNPNAYLSLAIEDAARRLFGDQNVALADNRSLAAIAALGLHDVLICLDGQRLHEGLLRRVRPAFRTIIMWQFEDPFMLDYNVRNTYLFDHVFTNDPGCAAAYGEKGHYLPLAASERFHFRAVKTDAELDYDIFFAGTMWPNRVETLRRVVAAFPDARLKLVCPINEYLPPLPDELARLAIQWPVSHESFIDFANASRVTLTLFRNYASHSDIGQAAAPGPRLFEIGYSGTAQVVEYNDGIDPAHFGALSGIELAHDAPQLIGSIRRILDDPVLRARNAHEAQRAVAASQLYVHRLERIRDITQANFARFEVPAATTPADRRMRVLICTRAAPERPGQVEIYQRTLSTMLKGELEYFFWIRHDRQCHLTDAEGTVLQQFDMQDIGWFDTLDDAPEEAAFSNMIGRYKFDLVHFQHLGRHAASLPIIAKAAGAGTVFTAHDFFLVCSRNDLLNHEKAFCDIAHKSISACDLCLRLAENVQAGAQQTRRSFMVEVIRSIDLFLFSTEYSAWLTIQIYPEVAKHRSLVLGFPSPDPVRRRELPVQIIIDDAPLEIAIAGGFALIAGFETAMHVIEEADPQQFRFHLFGDPGPELAETLARWNKPNVVLHDRHRLTDPDYPFAAEISLHLSIWPETYCLSLSETWQAGMIPVVSDIGALADRVEHGVNGFKVPVGQVSAILDMLQILHASPALRRTIKADIAAHLWTRSEDHAAALLEAYRSVAPAAPLGQAEPAFDIGQLHLLSHPHWRNLPAPRHIFDPGRRPTIRLELPASIQDWSHIQGSELYIDSVCEQTPEMLAEKAFVPSQELLVNGWSFVPGLGIEGEVHLALIEEAGDLVIFCPASRETRDDILLGFPEAPRRSGFSCRVALRGRWCEGRFRVALINSIGERAAFVLTGLSIVVREGQIRDAVLLAPANDQIIQDFHHVAARNGRLPGIALAYVPVAGKAWQMDQVLRYNIDRITGDPDSVPGNSLPDKEILVAGWAFWPEVMLAGQIHVALVDTELGTRIILPATRAARSDLAGHFTDAPICGGFSATAILDENTPDGSFECVLVNIVNGQAACQLVGYRMTIRDALVRRTVRTASNPQRIARVQACLTARPPQSRGAPVVLR